MTIPTTLKHKPVVVSEDYDSIDGRYSGDSDAKGLSVGLAQWNDRGRVEASAKVWRYTGEKWSRQSEELPLHRVLDLAILVCRTKQYLNGDAGKHKKLYDEANPTIDRIPLQGGAMNVAVCTGNERIDEDIQLLRDAIEGDQFLDERLSLLSAALKEMGY